MGSLKDIVRAARIERNMSLSEFAAAVGISEGVLASMEYGGRPSQPMVDRLAAFLQRPVTDLDPDGTAVRRQALRPKNGSTGTGPDNVDTALLESLVVLHAEFDVAHRRIIAAVRACDPVALSSARRQQDEIFARQAELIEGYLSSPVTSR